MSSSSPRNAAHAARYATYTELGSRCQYGIKKLPTCHTTTEMGPLRHHDSEGDNMTITEMATTVRMATSGGAGITAVLEDGETCRWGLITGFWPIDADGCVKIWPMVDDSFATSGSPGGFAELKLKPTANMTPSTKDRA
ncbi:unnamed protein product [Phytophthora fragariaefolia]|uniref:Unnamed protein product n=1 Tax=Phytophthora fragariaefolia TaxID=1490495 RepID=A0A9W6Y9P0_9STRA|nr:unnamed protein product [Phytophthora fragariaefolia]